jgi:hypothetical protein
MAMDKVTETPVTPLVDSTTPSPSILKSAKLSMAERVEIGWESPYD